MHGVVVEINVSPGDAVEANQVVAVVEAMKMMNEIRAHKSGTVTAVLTAPGTQIESGAALLTLAS